MVRVHSKLDDVIAILAPSWALRRSIARAEREIFFSTYAAAEKSRATRGWRAPNKSADGALIPDLATVTPRARQMYNDNPFVRSMIRSYRRNVAGRGITPAPKARMRNGKDRTAFNEAARKAWNRWAKNPKFCDVEGRKTFYHFQRWASGEQPLVGQCLIIIEPQDNGPGIPGFALRAVEAEQLDTSIHRHNNNAVRGGVEINANGRALAYWVLLAQPEDIGFGFSNLKSTRIPADQVVDLFEQERAGQTRGASWLMPSLRRARELDEYDTAERFSAKLGACIGVIIKRALAATSKRIGLLDGGTDPGTDTNGNTNINFEPGMVGVVDNADDITMFNPSRPGNTYQPYTETQLQGISAGGGLSYEQTTRNFHRGNFSSQRQALLEDRREWRPMQDDLIDKLCQRVWREFVITSAMQGLLPTPDRFWSEIDEYCECDWQPDGWEWIDPAKFAAAMKILLDMKIDTRERILNEMGRGVREVFEQIRDEQELADELGIVLPETAGASPTSPSEPRPRGANPPPDDEDEDVENEKLSRALIEEALADIDPSILEHMLR